MSKEKVLVLMGGISTEREISLKSGNAVAKALAEAGYNVETLDVGADNVSKIAEIKPDVCYLALHGKGGEDGCIQGMLEWMGIPYTGPGVAASAICMDKALTKKVLVQSGIPTPKSLEYTKAECTDVEKIKNELIEKLGIPVVLKSPCQGSSIGVVIVRDEASVAEAIEEVFKYGDIMLAEQFVSGVEISVPVVGNDNPEVYPIIEIVPTSEFYDFESKYVPGMSEHIIPARISAKATENVNKYAKEAYEKTGCRGVSRIDFIVDENDNPYVIEINTIPGMTATSLVPDSARYLGIEFPELVDKIVKLALEK